MSMMHFDDLDIVIVAQSLRRDFDQLDEHVDAHAHVRGEDNRNAARELRRIASLSAAREPGGADHGADLRRQRTPRDEQAFRRAG